MENIIKLYIKTFLITGLMVLILSVACSSSDSSTSDSSNVMSPDPKTESSEVTQVNKEGKDTPSTKAEQSNSEQSNSEQPKPDMKPESTNNPDVKPTPIVAMPSEELQNTEVVCENMNTHIYCKSKDSPVVPKGVIPPWGEISNYSPEVFCATDLPDLVCSTITSSLIAAMIEWGSYSNVEYWILGSDKDAASKLTDLNCERRDTTESLVYSGTQMPMKYCLEKHGPSGDHGFESYRKLSEDAINQGQPMGSMGLNGERDWGIHYFTSSIPFGLTDHFPFIGGGQEQKGAFHEYFHAVQHSYIQTTDRNKRDELLGLVWFVEGGAEYMAQVKYFDAISSGIIQPVNADGPEKSPYKFKENMRNKLLGGKDSVKYNCPGSTIKDFSYQNSCNNAGYDLGAWAIAYLDNKVGENSLIDTFYPNLNDLGWEGAFNLTYEMSSEDFYSDFESFLKLPISEQMKILPDK
ncbi:MAG: hypothetical protein CL782_02380 [Chloroflexi bacterium]|nr:hypothetical protein [Chloroflexota bacterium]|tara:strand:+ start:922 stop:2313 length:1392 start_codon:yes stop_codon:yes gene_type:complete